MSITFNDFLGVKTTRNFKCLKINFSSSSNTRDTASKLPSSRHNDDESQINLHLLKDYRLYNVGLVKYDAPDGAFEDKVEQIKRKFSNIKIMTAAVESRDLIEFHIEIESSPSHDE